MERSGNELYDDTYATFEDTLIDPEGYLRRQAAIADAAARAELQLKNGETFGLRAHQTPAFAAGVSFLQTDRTTPEGQTPSAHFVLPTGYGKSFLIAQLAVAAGVGDQSIPEQFRPQAMIFVPSRELKEQTIGDQQAGVRGLAEHAPHLKVMTAEEAHRTGERADIQVATYMWAIRALRDGRLKPGQLDLFFHDEGHHVLGDVTHTTLRYLCGDAFNFGLTATPEYSNERTIAAFFPKRLARISMVEGILEHKFLSNVQLFTLHSQELIRDVGNKQNDFVEEEVGHLAESDIRNKNIVATALHALEHTKGKGMIRCIAGNEQAHARSLAKTLSELRHPLTNKPIVAEAIGTFRADGENEQILRRFATTSDIDVLLSVRKGGEGYDVPDLRWGILAAPTTSYLSLEQFLGRGLRPKSPNNLFVLYQVIDAISESHRKTQAYAHRLFDLAEPPPQGHIIGDQGIPIPPLTKRRAAPGNSIKQDEDEALFVTGSLSDMVILEKTQTVVRQEDTDISSRYPLQAISKGSGIDAKVLRAILAETGHEAITTIALDNEAPEHFYNKEALNSVFGDIALNGDASVTELSKRLGISVGNLMNELNALDIPIPHLYNRRASVQSTGRKQKPPKVEPFVRQKYVERLSAHIKNTYQEIQPQEIGVEGICELTGKTAPTITQYLDDRDFPYTQRKLHAKKSRVYDRAQIVDWHQRYTNAEPFDPESDYVIVQELARSSDYRTATLLSAATQTQTPVGYFKLRQKVVDCVHKNDVPALLEAAKEYQAETSARFEAEKRKESRDQLAAAAEVTRFAVDLAITELDAQPMYARHPETGAELYAGTTRVNLLKHIAKQKTTDLHIANDEPAIIAALKNIEYTEPEAVDFAAQYAAKKSERAKKPPEAPAISEEPAPAPLGRATHYQTGPIISADAERQARHAQRPSQAGAPYLKPRHVEAKIQRMRVPQARHFEAIAGQLLPSGRPLVNTAKAIHQPVGILLAVIAHDPRFDMRNVGFNHDKQIVAEPRILNMLRAVFHGVSMIPLDWSSVHDIANDHNLYVEDLLDWAQTSGFDEANMRIIKEADKVKHVFISPPIARQLLQSIVTIQGGQQRYR